MQVKNEHVDDEDFLIQISPRIDEDLHWTGHVEVSIIFSDDSSLSKDESESLLFFCQMVCAAVPIYEEHTDIREMAAWLVTEKYAEEGKKKLNGGQRRAEVLSTENNVIKINFNPKKEH
tara:strand:- start:12 stop:368 length:357 start_codon:yes stop_codon:yes gene_type:complete